MKNPPDEWMGGRPNNTSKGTKKNSLTFSPSSTPQNLTTKPPPPNEEASRCCALQLAPIAIICAINLNYEIHTIINYAASAF